MTHLLLCVLGLLVMLSDHEVDAAESLQASNSNQLTLWYEQPATAWTEALPLGNGSLGAMVFSGITRERFQLNESTVWTGQPRSYANPGAVEHLPEIRALLQEMRQCERDGDLKEASRFQQQAEALAMDEFMSIPLTLAAYQPTADLLIDFPTHTESTNYRRELDLKTGITRVRYTTPEAAFLRESFASFPDQCLITRILADQPGSLSFELSLTSSHANFEIESVATDGLILKGKVNNGVIEFEVHLQLDTVGGEVTTHANGLTVSGAEAATIRVVAVSNFNSYKSVDQDPRALCLQKIEAISNKTYEEMRAAHLKDYQSLFNRASVDLVGVDYSHLPTDLRVAQFVETGDHGLVNLLFQFGRYLMIAGSRQGGQPLNLQGIWNDRLNPPWGSKYTTNINLQMNYWPVNSTGLSECHLPLLEALKELSASGSLTAKEHYGADGWVLHHNFDLWRATAPVNKSNHGIWAGGSGWLALHIWEQFLYSGDLAMLQEYYPVMKGAVEFYTDFLYEDAITGYLISGPSNSPENGGLVMGPTMDHQIIRSLFNAFALASRLVGDDSALSNKAADLAPRIAPNQVGQHGQLQEWLEDKDRPNNKHRHVSHLWGVHPGYEITWQDEVLLNAAKQSLVFRGDEATGWSMGWKINLWARFLDGDHALLILRNLITPARDGNKATRTAGLYPNLFDAHPPFQIDGNFGATAGIAEMLLQSHIMEEIHPEKDLSFSDFNFVIHLLPALPADWQQGSFTGLLARGGFEISARWDNAKLQRVQIKSLVGNPCQLKYNDTLMDLHLAKGELKIIHFETLAPRI